MDLHTGQKKIIKKKNPHHTLLDDEEVPGALRPEINVVAGLEGMAVFTPGDGWGGCARHVNLQVQSLVDADNLGLKTL